MRNFLSKQEAIEYFKTSNPYSTCDYLLTIESVNPKLDKFFALKGYQFPKAGVTFAGNGVAGFPHPTPHVDFGEIALDALCLKPQRGEESNQFNALWARQFNDAGELIFVPAKDRPTIIIQTMDENADVLFYATGCTFSYPTPTINYGADEPSNYHIVVWYEDARVYPTRWKDNVAKRDINYKENQL